MFTYAQFYWIFFICLSKELKSGTNSNFEELFTNLYNFVE